MDTEIKELTKKAEGDNTEFIKHVLEKHKPKENFHFKVDEEIKKTSLKKVLTKIIAVYHPDKVLDSEPRKKVLFEEITKLLNNIYTVLKG